MHKIIEILETKCKVVEYQAKWYGAPAYMLYIKYENMTFNAVVYVHDLGTNKKSHRIAKTILNELHRIVSGDEGRYKYVIAARYNL